MRKRPERFGTIRALKSLNDRLIVGADPIKNYHYHSSSCTEGRLS